jgi:hypothetical protein
MSLISSIINKVLSPAESEADLVHLERNRREQRAVYDLQAQANAMLREPDLSEVERIQINQAVDRAYWNWQWSTAQRLVRRHWR